MDTFENAAGNNTDIQLRGYCDKCGKSNGVMRLYYVDDQRLCKSHAEQLNPADGVIRDKVENDRQWFSNWFKRLFY